MKFSLFIKKILHPNEYKEYIRVSQQLTNKQLESTTIFMKVKNDANRSTSNDEELNKINDEANLLLLRLIELRKIFEPSKKA